MVVTAICVPARYEVLDGFCDIALTDEDTVPKYQPTVLLVDDEPGIREGVKRIFRNDGLTFLEASDGREALDIMSRHSPNVILLDLQMPRMDGFNFLKELRKSHDEHMTPICVMTGSSGKGARQRAIDLGADDFVRKPTDVIELRTRMQSLLRISNYQQKLNTLNAGLEKKVLERTSELCDSVARLEVAQKETDLVYHEMVLRLTMAAEAKDKCTGAHLDRMGHYSALLATRCGWPAEDAARLCDAAKMHDIGKLGIPDAILGKVGKLTKEEFHVMQRHTEIGAKILSNSTSKMLQMGSEIALTHHERYDGSGYPCGLRGEEIPEVGRIVAIADVFDALMSNRPYKRAWSLEKTVDTMLAESGRHFDPVLIELFLLDTDQMREIQVRFSEDVLPE